MRKTLATLALLAGAIATAHADDAAIGLRTGNHPGFGRIVFDLPSGQTYSITPQPDALAIRFPGTNAQPVSATPPHNVTAISTAPGGAQIRLAPGSRITTARLGDRLVIDIADATAPQPATPAPERKPAAAAPAIPAAARAPLARLDARFHTDAPAATPPLASPPDKEVAAAAPPPAPAPAEATTAQPQGPVAIAAAPVADAHAILLPFAATTGAAAFRRQGEAIIVFDERRPIDLAPLRADASFAQASVNLLPNGTVLRLPLGPGEVIALAHERDLWRVAIAHQEAPDTAAIRPTANTGRLRFPVSHPGGVVAMPDPATGASILVGVTRQPGEALPVPRRLPEFELLATWQGVALIPLADRLALRASPDAFILAAPAPTQLALGAKGDGPLTDPDSRAISRLFDLPDLPEDALLHRLQSAIATAASTPAQARTANRLQVAQAMLALGMGAEAQSVLALAGEEDAHAADNPAVGGLGAIAALLAGRPQEAAALRDPRLSGTDEIAFWRAILAAQDPGLRLRAAPVLAATVKLPLAYPAPLRNRLLPLIAETMVQGGERAAATALLATRPDDPSLDYARALLADPAKPAEALKLYDKVAASPDRLQRARALARATELRLSTGALTQTQAADALEKQIYAWRGGSHERALRERVAALRAATGAPRAALAMLRDTETVFPEAAADLHKSMTEIFTNTITAEGAKSLTPLDLVALAAENTDLIPEGEPGQRLAATLADRLMRLDLPERAEPVLTKLIQATAVGDARTELGGHLAAMQLAANHPDAALATLADTTRPGPLPQSLLEARTLTFANAAAKAGRLPDAIAALEQLNTDTALDVRAGLLEAAKDWPAATAALSDWTSRTLPATGPLTEPQAKSLLRLATAAAQASDESVLTRLREHDTARLPEGPTLEMFRLLTARPIEAAADLPRAAAETQNARATLETKTAQR